MQTRIFKSGNSLAVRIPKELAFEADVQDVEIERRGDSLLIRPLQTETLGDLMQVFASFPKSFMKGGRDFHEQQDRDWGDSATPKGKKK